MKLNETIMFAAINEDGEIMGDGEQAIIDYSTEGAEASMKISETMFGQTGAIKRVRVMEFREYTPEEQVSQFGHGFLDGVNARGLPPWTAQNGFPPAYLDGVNKGVEVFRQVLDEVREELKCPK